MLGNQIATVFTRKKLSDGDYSHPGQSGVVLDEKVILHDLKQLSEKMKENLLSWFLETRTDRYLILFSNKKIGVFKPDHVIVQRVDDKDWKEVLDAQTLCA